MRFNVLVCIMVKPKLSTTAGKNLDLAQDATGVVGASHIVALGKLIMVAVVLLYFAARSILGLFIVDASAIYIVFFLYLATSTVIALQTRKQLTLKTTTIINTMQIALDLVWVTLLVHFSGDLQSRLAFMYLIPVLSAAILSSRAILWTTGASFVCYYGLLAVVHFGLIRVQVIASPTIEYFSSLQLVRHAATILIASLAAWWYIQSIKRNDERLVRLKDDFMFMVLHDLRSPTTAIRWITAKYRQPESAKRYPEIQADMLAMETSIDRVMKISNTLLLIAKGEHVTLETQNCDLAPAIITILREMEPEMSEKNIVVTYDPPKDLPAVVANLDFLKEALSNLIGNAIKYNNQNGQLKITHTIESGWLRTSILNTGAPIDPDTVQTLFHQFSRGVNETKIPGTGLGLYITRKLIEKMGGQVGVEKSTNDKTVFYVLIPLAPTR